MRTECNSPDLRAALHRVTLIMILNSKLFHKVMHQGFYKKCGKSTCLRSKVAFLYVKGLLERTSGNEKTEGLETPRN